VVFGPRAEIVQPVAGRAPAAPAKARVAAEAPVRAASLSAKPARGDYYVQLGAYANAGVARDAWGRYTRQVPALAEALPYAASVSTRAGRFYRLSVGGFARNDANTLCRQVKARGGACFVRTQAGDALAAWAKGREQLASR
jgi:cell division septation protein DedD